MQELPSGKGAFSGVQGASVVYILSTHRYIRMQREEKEDWKGTEKRLMSVFSPRLLSFLYSYLSHILSFCGISYTKNAFILYFRFFKYHLIDAHECQSFKWTKYRVKYWVIWRDNRIAGSAVKTLTDTYSDRICKTYQILYIHESMEITIDNLLRKNVELLMQSNIPMH